ncbi:Zn-dependent protease [Halarchaeum rubridurum]|uniref:Zn-dependent protease n=1 Tax=Halarchaeum rubridurum TaxID=489911 RepID=A0A830FY84_9EURY|nr:metalloprotease [Halarchaeum rubridurum]MBP1953360.1 Zn-dependent protease [Halarchaeum rubridurum]GGM65896.1 Zn-dependent protease [Halarchaeum rubridurum]
MTRLSFGARELRDLLVAWLALGVAFAFFYERITITTLGPVLTSGAFLAALAVSLLTAGVGFLLHELAHKVVAVRYGQVAAFRADYGLLALAVLGGLAGFLFAAPGAVVHRGRLTERQSGLIALAGPVTNLALAALFAPFAFLGSALAWRGVTINLLLAGFNMLPVGPLDGNTVRSWSLVVYVAVAVPSIALAAYALYV